jgi:hypothetical protein
MENCKPGRIAAAGRPGRWCALLAGVWVILAAVGCSTPGPRVTDFDRHRYSQLVEPPGESGTLYFDVRFSAEYPRDDPSADTVRLAWLDGWLKLRRICPAGSDVVRRRPFDFLEDNPARYDERWEIACRPAAAPAG